MFSNYILFIVIVPILCLTVNAQIPDKFTNLQVLPGDISKEELLQIMKSFSFSLGVRCNHCHEGKEGQPLSTFNFASDTIITKLKARTMIKMTHDINSNYLSELSEFKVDIIQVKCETCHRGVAQPELLEDLLFSKIKIDGIDEAITEYNNLYKKYYGSFAYDFKDHTLLALTQMLNKEEMFDESIAFARINIEKYPESGTTHFGLAESYELKGDTVNAIKYYTKSLELMPGGKVFIEKKLEELAK